VAGLSGGMNLNKFWPLVSGGKADLDSLFTYAGWPWFIHFWGVVDENLKFLGYKNFFGLKGRGGKISSFNKSNDFHDLECRNFAIFSKLPFFNKNDNAKSLSFF
jgi:hypothetical protein